MTNLFTNLLNLSDSSRAHRVHTLALTVGSPSAHRRRTMLRLCSVLAILLTLGVGNVWGAVGGTLKTYNTNSSTFKTGYARQAGDNFVWYGQKNYYGANKKATHDGLKPTAADLPVVKAQNASATTTTTGYYWCYTSESVSNVGAIQITFSAKDGSSTVNAYVVTSSTAASSGSATWTKLTLLTGSPSAQGANVASAGTYTFTFPKETTAKYYGVVFVTSSYWRATGFQMKLLEGCTAPTAVAKGDLTSSSFALSITDAQNADNYDVYFSTSSTAPTASTTAGSFSTVDTKTPTISSGVAASTTYYVWARSAKTVSTVTYKSAWVALTGNTLTTPSAASCNADPTIGDASLNGSFSLSSIPLQCSMTSDGGTGCTITDAGFVWKAGSDPSSSDNKTEGTYSSNITGSITGTFSKGTTYKIKAYATNGHGTALSSSSFTLIPRSVTFHKNDGSETTTVQYVNDGTATALTANAWSRTGYTFSGWNTNADGKSGDGYADGANVTASGGDVDLYAKWTEKPKYTITLDAGNGTISDANWTNTSGSTYTRTQSNGDESITLPTPSCGCAGWVFKGWSTTSKSNADSFTPDKADGASFTPSSNVTYYAVYRQSTPSGTTYNKITSSGDLTSGDYAIIGAYSESGNYYSMRNIINASGYMNETAFSHATSWTNNDADYIWKVLVFGEKVAFYSADVSKFLTINDDGEWELSTDGQLFSKEFNSTTKAWTFTSSTGYQLTYSNQFYVGTSQSKSIYLYKRGNAESGNYYTSPTCSSLSVTGAASPVAGGTVQVSATTANNGDKVWAVYTIDKNYNFDSWSVSGTGASLSSTSAQFTEITIGSADVTVTAGFERKDWHVQWKVNGVEITGSDLGDAQNYYDNDEWATVLPPNPSSCDDGDGASDVFVGWTTNTWGGKSTEPAVLFKNGRDAPVINADVTYHAVFAKESSTTYKRITSTKYIGLDSKIVIVNDNSEKALKNDYSAVDVSSNLSADDATLSSVSSDWVWTAKSQDSDGYYILKNGSKQLGIDKTGGMTSSYSACGDYNTVASAWDLWEASDTKEFNTTTSNCFYLWNWATASYYNFLTLYNGTTWESKYYANTSSKGSPTASENAMRLYIPEYTNYLISCCTAYDITLTGSGTVTGGTIEADPTSACEGAAVTLAATPSTGYTFTEWIVKDGSANVVTSDVIAGGDEDDDYTEMTMPDYDVTVDATFTAKEYTIVLDKNGGTSDGGATATYNSSSLSSVTDASYTGHTLLGYYTETSGGDMVITANGALVASVSGYTDANAKWIYDDDEVFAAHWKPNGTWNVTITAPSNGTITVTYNSGANSMTSGSAYIGGDVTITATGSTGYELATDGLKVNGTTFTSGNSLTLSEDITIAATFSLKKHNVAVTELSTVTISAGDIDEGENDDVDYGSSLTLSYSTVTSGHYWSGWKVTNEGGDDVTDDVVSGSTLTVPDYDIIVTAKIYGDVKAWCIPTFNVTGDVHLTSTAGVTVTQTSAASNLINFSGSDLYNVSKITISYLDENGDAVANASSPLRLCVAAGNTLAESNINSSSFTSGAYNQDYAIRFVAPTGVYDEEYNYKLKLELHKVVNGVAATRVIKTIEHSLNGRSLPKEFVIAAKSGDNWYALPNTLAGTQDAQGAITPVDITSLVDNTTTPTKVTNPDGTATYGATGRYTAANVSGIRFTNDGSHYIQISSISSNYKMWLSGSGGANVQDWYLKSSDFGAYEVFMDPIGSPDETRRIELYTSSGVKMGHHGTRGTPNIYLLPVEYSKVDDDMSEPSIMEWGTDHVVMELRNSGLAYSYKTQVGGGALSDATALYTVRKDAGVYRLPITLATADAAKELKISFYRSNDVANGVFSFTVPVMISADDAATSSIAAATAAQCDLVVLNGGVLTVSETTSGAKKTFRDLYIYGGGKMVVPTGTYVDFSNVYMRGGHLNASWQYQYSNPQLVLNGTMGNASDTINYDYLTNNAQFYSLALPYPVKLKNIVNPYFNNKRSWEIHAYNGRERSTGGTGWYDVEVGTGVAPNRIEGLGAENALSVGVGYTFWGAMQKVNGTRQLWSVNRFKMPLASGTAEAEKFGEGEGVDVKAYGMTYNSDSAKYVYDENIRKNNAGWNMVGNPFLANINGSEDLEGDMEAIIIDHHEEKVMDDKGKWTGQMKWVENEEGVRYVRIPYDNGENYRQVRFKDTTFRAFHHFFIQVGVNGKFRLEKKYRAQNIIARMRANGAVLPAEMDIDFILRNGNDKTSFGLTVNDAFVTGFQAGEDMPDELGGVNMKGYTLANGERLSYNGLPSVAAEQLIPVGYRAQTAGTHTISYKTGRYDDYIEHIWLTDYVLGQTVDLLNGAYEFTTGAGVFDDRFALNVVFNRNQMPTGIDEVESFETDEAPVKFIYNDKMFIRYKSVLYDATGKKVGEVIRNK